MKKVPFSPFVKQTASLEAKILELALAYCPTEMLLSTASVQEEKADGMDLDSNPDSTGN